MLSKLFSKAEYKKIISVRTCTVYTNPFLNISQYYRQNSFSIILDKNNNVKNNTYNCVLDKKYMYYIKTNEELNRFLNRYNLTNTGIVIPLEIEESVGQLYIHRNIIGNCRKKILYRYLLNTFIFSFSFFISLALYGNFYNNYYFF